MLLAPAEDDLEVVVEVVEAQAAGLVNPPVTTSQLLDGLEDAGLIESVALIRAAISYCRVEETLEDLRGFGLHAGEDVHV